MVERGALIGEGRTSEVFTYGAGYVVKLLRSGVPPDWADLEAYMTGVVHSLGLPVPDVDGVVAIDGRPGVVFEHVAGPSMWQEICENPGRTAKLTALMAEVQRAIHRVGVPPGVPDLVHRLEDKLRRVQQLTEAEREEGCALARSLPSGAALLHGDLHPGNVLMSPSGPVVIDWFDAAIGHPLADVVRSSILIRPALDGSAFLHLPDAREGLLDAVHTAYVSSFADLLTRQSAQLAAWEAVVAASRLVEGAQTDESTLVELWRSRGAAQASTALTSVG